MKKKSGSKRHSAPQSIATAEYNEPKRVTIEEADNGYVVSHHGMHGSKSAIAKNHKEVVKHMKKFMK